jgi:hypothetical protein
MDNDIRRVLLPIILCSKTLQLFFHDPSPWYKEGGLFTEYDATIAMAPLPMEKRGHAGEINCLLLFFALFFLSCRILRCKSGANA